MNRRISRRAALHMGSAAFLAAMLVACGTTSSTAPTTQPTTSANNSTATSAPASNGATAVTGMATSAPASSGATTVIGAATTVPAAGPTFSFEPHQGGPGTVVQVRGWNFSPGAPVKVRLGLPQPVGEVLVSAFADPSGVWTTQMTMPGALPSGEPITQTDLRLVVMDDANVALASAPFAFVPAASLPTPYDAQPATEPMDAVQRFLQAAQADRSGKQAIAYADGNLRTALENGTHDIGALLGEQNPFSGFKVDRIVSTASPLAYVQATLSYGTPPQPGATRIFTVKGDNGIWRVTGISPASADDPAVSPEQQARNAAAQFVLLLNSGRYQEAGAWFGGDMQPLLDQNPDLSGDAMANPELRGQLLERACTVNGYACRAQRRIVDAQQTDNDEFNIWMEFNNADGSLYQHPVDGRTAFELRLQRIDNRFKVMELLPYTS